MIIVTPHLTAPSDKLQDIPTPVDSGKEPGPVAQILAGQAFDKPLDKPVTPEGRP